MSGNTIQNSLIHTTNTKYRQETEGKNSEQYSFDQKLRKHICLATCIKDPRNVKKWKKSIIAEIRPILTRYPSNHGTQAQKFNRQKVILL